MGYLGLDSLVACPLLELDELDELEDDDDDEDREADLTDVSVSGWSCAAWGPGNSWGDPWGN